MSPKMPIFVAHFFTFAPSSSHAMKRWPLFLLLMLLVTIGCRRRPPLETLSTSMPAFAEVYALKDSHPDSALCLMQGIAKSLDEMELHRRSPFLYNEYQVLKTELHYKTRQYFCDDTLTLRAFAFYDSLVSPMRGARRDETLFYQFTRSLYYKAVVESHQGKKAESYADFLRALGAIDGLAGHRDAFHFRKPNPEYEHFTALTYDRLAEFFNKCDEWDEALECLALSNKCFELAGSSEGLASNYELMGDVMLAQGDRYASLDYYNKSDSIYETLGNHPKYLQYSRILHDALKLFNEGNKEQCNELLNNSLQQSKEGSHFAKRIHFTLGYFYFEGQMFDSALYHYENSLSLLPRQTLKAYCRIIEAANALGDSVKAAQYGQLLADLSMERFYQSAEKSQSVSLFEEYKDEKDTVRGRRLFLYIVGLILFLGIVITAQSYWIHRRRKRNKADREQHEREKASLEQEISQTLAEAQQKEERITALQKELKKALANPDFQKLPLNEKLDILMQMPMSKRALKVLEYNAKAGVSYPELVMTENQLGQLITTVDTVFPKFSVKMIERYPRLKRSDIMYCCFYILGLNEIQAAILTGKTYQAVWKRSTKLQDIFDTKSSLQFVLRNIIKDWK